MLVLEKKFPDVHEQFQKGNFVIHKTERIFSGIAIDHAGHAPIFCPNGKGTTQQLSEKSQWKVICTTHKKQVFFV